MRANLYESRPIEHDDQIGHTYRRESVGNKDRNAAAVTFASAARRRSIVFEQRVFRLCIKRGGRFIEDQKQRLIAHETTRQRKFLPLAERELDSARPRRTELRSVQTSDARRHHRPGARQPQHGWFFVHSDVAQKPTECLARNLKRKILKRSARRSRHSPRWHARRRVVQEHRT